MTSTPRKKKGAAAPTDEAAEVAKAKAAQKKIDDDAQTAADIEKKAPTRKKPANKTIDNPVADAKADAIKLLPGIAKEVNARFESIERTEARNDDARLSTAYRLAEAKELCKTAGLTFKKWCEDNITNGYNLANKLALIGASEDPPKALADLRSQGAASAVKHREKAKAAKAQIAESSKPSTTVTPFRRAEEAINALDDKTAVTVARNIASKAGLAIVSETDAKELVKLRSAVPAGPSADLDGAKKAFDALSPGDKMKLMEYAAKATGMMLTNPLAAVEIDPLDIPGYLKGREKKS